MEQRTCVVCGERYMPVRKDQRNCSSACRRAALRTRPPRPKGTRPCEWCGIDFGYHPKIRMRFCSNRCRALSRTHYGQASLVPWHQCVNCERWFIARRSRRYCAPSCYPSPYVSTAGTLRTWRCKCGATAILPSRQGQWACDECKREAKADGKARRRARHAAVERIRYKRRDIYERDGWRCQLCGKPVARTQEVPHPQAPTIDHIIPLSRNGPDTPANVQCAHFRCNALKGNRPHDEQLRLI